MSTATTWQTESTSLENTLELAARIGRELRGGEVIELASDLGGGKTSFVRGLARGMGSTDHVRSPSFTISNQYRSGSSSRRLSYIDDQLVLYHFDFHRLQEPGIMRGELAEILADPRAVVVVEWADIIEDTLPAERLAIRIRTTGEQSRQFTFSLPGALRYLLPKHSLTS